METMEPHRVVRVHRPETLSAQYKNGFGETDSDDRPWPRGEVIYAGRGSPMHTNNPVFWRPGYRSRGGGPRPGPHSPGYNQYQYYSGPQFRRPYRPGYRGRRKPGFSRGGGGMYSAWNGSMPQGLHHCGYHAHRGAAHLDDEYIDDTLVSDLSQFRLHGDLNGEAEGLLYGTGEEPRLALQTRTLAKNCASTPHLVQAGAASRPKSVNTRINHRNEATMSSSISPAATSDASNPADRLSALGDHSETGESVSSMEPQNTLDTNGDYSPGSLSALRSPAEFLTLVWDIST